MRNKWFSFAIFFAPLFFASCAVYVVDNGYTGAPAARPAAVSPVYSNTAAYTFENVAPEVEMTMKVYDNRFVFFRMHEPIAVWILTPDGMIIKKGEVIDGLVRMYYAPGKIGAEIMYRNNRRDDAYRAFYPNGRLFESGFYRAGIREGAWQRFTAEGMLTEDYVFSKGAKKVVYMKEKKPVYNNEWNFDDLNREENYTRIKTGQFRKEEAFPKKFKRQSGSIPEYNKEQSGGDNNQNNNHNWNNGNNQNSNENNHNQNNANDQDNNTQQEQRKSGNAVGYRANNQNAQPAQPAAASPAAQAGNASPQKNGPAPVSAVAKADVRGSTLNSSYKKTTQTAKGAAGKPAQQTKGQIKADGQGNSVNAKGGSQGNSETAKSAAAPDSAGNSGETSSGSQPGMQLIK